MRDAGAILAAALALAGCAAAPQAEASAPASGNATLRIGEEARFGGLGVRALRLEEDSRCPSGVQCVWAGRVRLAVRLSEGGSVREAMLGSDRSEPLAAGRVLHLVATCPNKEAGRSVPPAAYSFLIVVGRDADRKPAATPCDPS